MYEFLESNKLIYNRQFGFGASHPNNHALISKHDCIYQIYVDNGEFVAGIFIAFDTVNHEILCNKLS